MAKYLGIDYGEKRIGLSFGDELGVASPLPAAVEATKEQRLIHIGETIRDRKITDLVVGHPLNMDGTVGFKAREVEKFAEKLKARFGLPVRLVDERLTSHEAEGRLRAMGKKADRASGVVDSLAAALILQDYFDQLSPPLEPNPYDEDEYDDDDCRSSGGGPMLRSIGPSPDDGRRGSGSRRTFATSFMMRWKCVCAFDGGCFKGWQSQARGGTVQDTIESGLEKIFKKKVRIHGSSRTDAGVHARGMVFHFDADWKFEASRLEAALRTLLPTSIRVSPIRRAPPDFHARFSATGKLYRYYIHQGWADPFSVNYCWSLARPLSLEAMEEAANILRGRHDFTSFSAFGGREMETPVRDLRTLSVRRAGRRIIVTAEADGFLYKMARGLVGALVGCGIGKLTTKQVARILRERYRTHEIATAPPQGLFLEKVFYGRRS